MVFKIDNKDFDSSIFTNFSHDSKITELCNELYEKAKKNLYEVNSRLTVAGVNNYIPLVHIKSCEILSMTVTISPDNKVDMPYFIFDDIFQLVSITNQLSKPTICLNIKNFEKETFIECAGQGIDQLIRIYNTINKKIDYDKWTNISPIDPTKQNIKYFSNQILYFLEDNARISYCINTRPKTVKPSELKRLKEYIDLFQRWLYTIDVTKKDDKDFENLFTDTFSKSYNRKLSDFNNLRNVLIFALYESLEVYSILLKYFDNKEDVKQIVQNK